MESSSLPGRLGILPNGERCVVLFLPKHVLNHAAQILLRHSEYTIAGLPEWSGRSDQYVRASTRRTFDPPYDGCHGLTRRNRAHEMNLVRHSVQCVDGDAK